jgi:hypothetical protein
MLSYVPEITATMRGVGSLVGEQRPFIGFLMKNWPLAALATVALGVRLRERHKKGELSLYNGMADFGLIISPLVGLALLNQLAREDQVLEQQAAAATAPASVQGMGAGGYDFHPNMLAEQPLEAPPGQAPGGHPLDGVEVVNQTSMQGQGQQRPPSALMRSPWE